jgi:hypothetical protein
MDIKYVVRGALVQCNQGSTPSRLNLPKSHGIYVKGKPILNDRDSAANVNVMPFGDCSVCCGPCRPALAPEWDSAKGDALVKGRPALITESVLSCSLGGVITIKNDGQLG